MAAALGPRLAVATLLGLASSGCSLLNSAFPNQPEAPPWASQAPRPVASAASSPVVAASAPGPARPASAPVVAAPASAASTASAAAAVARAPAASAAPLAPVAAASEPQLPPAPTFIEPPVDPTVQRLFDDARRALAAGRTQDAERGFRTLVQTHPELGGPHANLGLLLRQAGKLDESLLEFERAVAASPKQAQYFNQLGIAHRLLGQFAKARDAYEKAIALDANNATALLNLGILNDLYLWDAARALELYTRYLALTPAGDATVSKWVADLKNRKPAQNAQARKEKE